MFHLWESIKSIYYLDKNTFKTTRCACCVVFKITNKKNMSINDCTELYTKTSSSLDSHCLLRSDYRHRIPRFPLHMVGESLILVLLETLGSLIY